MPTLPGKQCPDHLGSLKPPIDLHVWEQSYARNGDFSDQKARAYLDYLEAIGVYRPPTVRVERGYKAYNVNILRARVLVSSKIAGQVRMREPSSRLPPRSAMPRKDAQWLYVTILREALAPDSYRANIAAEVEVKFNLHYGPTAWSELILLL